MGDPFDFGQRISYKYTLLMELTRFTSIMLYTAFLLIGGVMGCSKSPLERNPYLYDLSFQQEIPLNLPQYDGLRFAGGSLTLLQFGHKGIHVFNLNGNDFLAWEASCPNHSPNDCSRTEITGVLAECSCENYRYSLATGQLLTETNTGDTMYPLVNYYIEKRGNSLFVSN